MSSYFAIIINRDHLSISPPPPNAATPPIATADAMSPYWYALRLIQAFEDRIVESILRVPGFHRAVGRIHRAINEKQYGRNPHEPLAPGEATADPNPGNRADGFLQHFLGELKNQARGRPSDISGKLPRK